MTCTCASDSAATSRQVPPADSTAALSISVLASPCRTPAFLAPLPAGTTSRGVVIGPTVAEESTLRPVATMQVQPYSVQPCKCMCTRV